MNYPRLPPLPRFPSMPSFPVDDGEITRPTLTRAAWRTPPPPQYPTWSVPTLRLPREWNISPVFVYGLAVGALLVVVLWLAWSPFGRHPGADGAVSVRAQVAGDPDAIFGPIVRRVPAARVQDQPPLIRAEDLPYAPEPVAAPIEDIACVPGRARTSRR